MSRVGRKVITLPKGVQLNVKDGNLAVKGPKGELKKTLPTLVKVASTGTEINVTRDAKRIRRHHGEPWKQHVQVRGNDLLHPDESIRQPLR